ncbi:hypothetical protein AB0D84_16335 [Streptomyces sp. NPDC048193]|uniref:hypothetical protein n=1 Tax=Streptomyces sp. NPDC048193 TaxID=3155630 RepID=UPI0034494C87
MRAFVEAAATGSSAGPRAASPRAGTEGFRRPGRVVGGGDAARFPLPAAPVRSGAAAAGARPGPVAPAVPAHAPAAPAVAAAPVAARRAPRSVVRPWRRLSPDERRPSRTAP